MGYCAYLEVSPEILCIFGRSSLDFGHFWKFLMGFSAFLEVLCEILCLFGISHGICSFSEDPGGIL